MEQIKIDARRRDADLLKATAECTALERQVQIVPQLVQENEHLKTQAATDAARCKCDYEELMSKYGDALQEAEAQKVRANGQRTRAAWALAGNTSVCNLCPPGNHRHPPSAHNHSPLAQGAIKRMESHHQRAESTAAEATAHLRAELASVKEAVQRETSSRAEYVEWRVAYCCPRGPRGEGRRGGTMGICYGEGP